MTLTEESSDLLCVRPEFTKHSFFVILRCIQLFLTHALKRQGIFKTLQPKSSIVLYSLYSSSKIDAQSNARPVGAQELLLSVRPTGQGRGPSCSVY